MEKGQKDFETISANVRKEIARFDRLRVNDFKTNVIKYLEVLMEKQQQVWNCFSYICLYMVLEHFGHGHFGLGRFVPDILATDVSATQNTKGGRFGQSH